MLSTIVLAAVLSSSPDATIGPEAVQDPAALRCFAGLRGELLTLSDCQQALDNELITTIKRARLLSAVALQYARTGDFAGAEVNMQEAQVAAPEDLMVTVNSGNLAVLQRRYQDALIAYERALTLTAAPLPQVHLNRSLALRGLGQYDQAKYAYETYQQLTNEQQNRRNGSDLQQQPVINGEVSGEIVPRRTLPESG